MSTKFTLNILTRHRDKINTFLSSALCIFLVYSGRIQGFGFAICCFLLICLNINAVRQFSRKDLLMLLLLCFPLLFILIDLPRTPVDKWHILKLFYETRGLCLIAPFTFLLLSKNQQINFKTLLNVFLISFSLLMIVLLIMADYSYLFSSSSLNVFSFRFRTYVENLIHVHPTYLSMYLVFGSVVILLPGMVKNKYLRYGSFFFFVFFLHLLSSKISFVALTMVLLYYIIHFKKQRVEYLVLMLICLLPIFMSSILIQTRWSEMLGAQSNELNSVYIRKLIFFSDLVLLKYYWFIGMGMVKLQEMLNIAFYYYSTLFHNAMGSYNTHNQYIELILQHGIIGMAYIVTVITVIIKKKLFRTKPILSALNLIIGTYMLTENIIDRQQGVFFVYLFLSLLFIFETENISSEKNIETDDVASVPSGSSTRDPDV